MKFYKIQRILSRYTGSQRYFLLDTNFPIKQSSDMERLRMTTKTGQAEWRALDENLKMRELPLAIELQDFTIDEYPPKLMLINNETCEALPSKKPENLFL